MDDQEPPIDAMLRGKALQHAIAHFGGSAWRYADPETVIETATKFYKFLKGEAQ